MISKINIKEYIWEIKNTLEKYLSFYLLMNSFSKIALRLGLSGKLAGWGTGDSKLESL